MATNSAPTIEITILPSQVVPSRARGLGGITNVRGRTWMESMEMEVVLSMEFVTIGIRWLTALLEPKPPFWWLDVFDNADDYFLIVIVHKKL